MKGKEFPAERLSIGEPVEAAHAQGFWQKVETGFGKFEVTAEGVTVSGGIVVKVKDPAPERRIAY